MTRKLEILNFISAIRESHDLMIPIFTNGSCLNFHFILKKVFPEAKPWYNIDHIVSKIGDRFYDIRGDVTKEVVKDKSYHNYYEWYPKKGTARATKQMMTAQYEGFRSNK